MSVELIYNFNIEIIYTKFERTTFKLRWNKIIVGNYDLGNGLTELIEQMRIKRRAYKLIEDSSLTQEGLDEKRLLEEILSIESLE